MEIVSIRELRELVFDRKERLLCQGKFSSDEKRNLTEIKEGTQWG